MWEVKEDMSIAIVSTDFPSMTFLDEHQLWLQAPDN